MDAGTFDQDRMISELKEDRVKAVEALAKAVGIFSILALPESWATLKS